MRCHIYNQNGRNKVMNRVKGVLTMISTPQKFLPGLLLLISLACCISGCAISSHGRMATIKRSQVDTIEIGVSTKKDIMELFGKPQQTIRKPNNIEVFVYIHGVEKTIGIPFLISWSRGSGTGQTLNIIFDQYGKVVDYEYITDERGMIE